MTTTEAKSLTDEESLAAALQLPAEMRARVAGCLLESLETPQEQRINPLWAEEAERRITAYKEGRLKAIPADEVFEAIRNRKKK